MQSRPIVSDPCSKERVIDLVIELGEDSGGDKGFRQGLSEILYTSIVGVFEQCHRSFCMKGPEGRSGGALSARCFSSHVMHDDRSPICRRCAYDRSTECYYSVLRRAISSANADCRNHM